MSDASGPLPERVEAMRTSPRFFGVLGVEPALGRWPTAEEERFGGPSFVVVSDGFWRRRGYLPVAGFTAELAWREHGEAHESVKPMQLWMRRLDDDEG